MLSAVFNADSVEALGISHDGADCSAACGLFDYIKTKYPEIPESIKNDKVLKEEVEEALRKAIGEYKEQFQAR